MKKPVFFLLLFLFISLVVFWAFKHRTDSTMLSNHTYISEIGVMYEETPDDNPCAGAIIYLVLKFSEDSVLITEKEISSCGAEMITSSSDYNWKLTPHDDIKIKARTGQPTYYFLNDLSLKIENEKLVGYKIGQNKKFIFERQSKTAFK